jgi:ribulose-5-phosphate 4-epimerase/fuculose-1-phosphate aldolase
MRTPEGFVISGTQTGDRRVLGSDGYVLVTETDVAENRVVSIGPVKPSSESLSHAAVYDARPDAMAVVHAHHAGAWQKALALHPATPPEVEAGTPEMAQALAALLAERSLPAVIAMAGHEDGLLACGTLEEAAAALLRLV